MPNVCLWASDWPHQDGAWPDPILLFARSWRPHRRAEARVPRRRCRGVLRHRSRRGLTHLGDGWSLDADLATIPGMLPTTTRPAIGVVSEARTISSCAARPWSTAPAARFRGRRRGRRRPDRDRGRGVGNRDRGARRPRPGARARDGSTRTRISTPTSSGIRSSRRAPATACRPS